MEQILRGTCSILDFSFIQGNSGLMVSVLDLGPAGLTSVVKHSDSIVKTQSEVG